MPVGYLAWASQRTNAAFWIERIKMPKQLQEPVARTQQRQRPTDLLAEDHRRQKQEGSYAAYPGHIGWMTRSGVVLSPS
jgi:hypothetical protein